MGLPYEPIFFIFFIFLCFYQTLNRAAASGNFQPSLLKSSTLLQEASYFMNWWNESEDLNQCLVHQAQLA